MNPKFHSAQDVEAALAAIDVLGVVKDAFLAHRNGTTLLPAEASMYWKDPEGFQARSIVMHASVPGSSNALGMKVINASIGNPTRGLDRAEGLILLFDPITARITDVFPAAAISAIRTAAVSTLAVRALQRPVRSLALLGAGALARRHAELLLGADVGIEEVLVFDIISERAISLAGRLGSVSARVVDSAFDAVTGAEVTVAATTVTEPYVWSGWLTRGSTFVNVSLDDLSDHSFLTAGKLYVDDWKIVIEDDRRALGRLYRDGLIVGPGASPPTGGRAVTAELASLFAGAAPIPNANEVTIVNPFGLGISDVALAATVRDWLEKRADPHRRSPAPDAREVRRINLMLIDRHAI